MTKTRSTKRALVLSALAILMCVSMLVGSTFAWFTDSVTSARNQIVSGNLDIELEYSTWDSTTNTWSAYAPVGATTKIFNENALYEPGYVQVVYLKVENKGDVAFDFHTAVSVINSSTAKNKFGQEFWLHEYLKFGIAYADSESGMEELVSTREKAVAIATMKLQNYDTDVASLEAGSTVYMALVVRMPKEIGNEANYQGTTIPKVDLGLIVKAEQQK